MLSNQELKSLTKKELLEELRLAGEMLVKKRITVKTKHEKDTSSVNKQKIYIARLNTTLREIELEEMVKDSTKI